MTESNKQKDIRCRTCKEPFEDHYLDQADGVGDWNWHLKNGPYLPTHDIYVVKGEAEA